MPESPVSGQRPYLLRAMHEWMIDNALTPHIVVDASAAGVDVPRDSVKDGKIVLNVSYAATRGLVIDNDVVAFEARFNGVPRSVRVPIDAVVGIYARENGQGMVFSQEPGTPPEDPGTGEEKRPKLKVVK
jgi:stringent starvation protein B